MTQVYSSVDQLPANFSLEQLKAMPYPAEVLMCPPDYFDVIDVKNPFMEGQIGKVSTSRAHKEWEDLKTSFEKMGVKVRLIQPVKDREDMVFCANQTFAGLDASGRRVCVLSHMKHPSRQKEVPAFAEWFVTQGYEVRSLREAESVLFEGSGDSLWHPGRALIWGGYGHRTDPAIYQSVSDFFGAPVLTLELKTERFYHLDTCFCPINEKTVLVYPPSLTTQGMELISHIFPDIIVVNQQEAMENMACNATAFFGNTVVLQRGSPEVNHALRSRGLQVIEVDTGEYMKSGGSVFCMKMSLF